jgi:ubiquitin-protein ligase
MLTVRIVEIGELRKQPPDGISIIVNEDDLLDIQAWIQGPGEFV